MHVLVNACFSNRPFYVCYKTYVTLNMHYSIYMFTMRLTYVKYAFLTHCTFDYVVKIMLPYDMVPQCKKLMHRITSFR